MKKTISIIAIALCLVLFVPSVPCYAFDTSNLYARTKASVSGFWDDPTQDHIQQCVTSLDHSNVNAIAAKVANLSSYGGAGDTFSKTYYAVFYWSNSNYIMVYSFDDSGYPFIFCPDSIDSNTYAISRYRICKGQSSDINSYAIGLSDNSFSGFTGSVSNENGVYVRDWTNGSLLCTNLPVYVYNDTQTTNLLTIQSLQETYTNYFPENLPYLNQEGEIVDPTPVVEYESNENHMYLKSCDVGFCKPYSVNDLSSAGGGYLYVKYSFDNWVNSHSSDYWVNIRTVVNVDGTQYSGINTRALDLNGVNVLTFSESTVPNGWGDEGLLFVEFPDNLVSTYKTGYVYNMPYLTFADTDSNGVSNRSRFLGNGRNRLFLTPSGGRGVNITDSPIGQALQDIFQVNVHQSFTITVTVWLQDTDNNRSGEFTKTFNLVTGVSSTTDTSITDNDNPFEPDPSLPDIPDGSGDDSYSVAPIVNNFTINGSGTIGYDPGYRDLKEDVDKDPDGNFTQYLDPMHNDEVGSWFMSFVNAMPSEMKAILITGAGVGVFFGLYRFVRRG